MMKLGIYLNSQHRERDDPARRLAETLEQTRGPRISPLAGIRGLYVLWKDDTWWNDKP